jgi:S-adenosylmethionine hydrolase
MTRPIITLTTDFGGGSHYVAAMRGAILAINPEATIVDVSHEIWPQDVRSGAWMMATTAPEFPPGTIHIGVVDPGVGTDRAIVIAEIGGQRFVAPDNGLLGLVAAGDVHSVYRVEEPKYWRHKVSATFHGRDIMAPVAAHLSLGVAPEAFGPVHDGLARLDWSEPTAGSRSIEGEIVFVDTFGNLISNIDEDAMSIIPDGAKVKVACEKESRIELVETYGNRPAETPVALVDSSGYLEVAVVAGDASQVLDGGVGCKVTVRW